jgi:probable rRNA maturation factor
MIELVYDAEDEALPPGGVLSLMKEGAQLAAEAEGMGHLDAEVSLTFASPEEIRELNNAYRDKDSVTDVLSFPQYEEDAREAYREGITIPLGDIVICPVRAAMQAEEYGHSPDRELIYLFVHGMFHLLGYDHTEDDAKKKMRTAEEYVLTQLGVNR